MRSSRSSLLLLLVSCCLLPLSLAQQTVRYGSIEGRLFLRDGQPAAWVEIKLEGYTTGVNTSVLTDPNGRFQFGSLLAGKVYTLTIELRDYQPIRRSIDLSMMHDYESITLQPVPSDKAREVPPEGPKAAIDARIAQIPPEAKDEFQQGQKRSAANDPAGAVTHFKKAIELFANYAEAFQLLGGTYLQQGQLPLAEEAFAKAVTIENRLANAQLALGLTRNLMGRTREAEAPLLKAVELDPKSPDAHFELAKTQFALQKFPDAEVHAEKSLELKPQNAPVYIVLGYSLLRQSKVAEAEEAFRHFLKIDPASPMASEVRQLEATIEQHEKQTRQP
jgi:tetratricopeptide (TPR) repeat protein